MTIKFIDSLPQSSVKWLPPEQHWIPPEVAYFQEKNHSSNEEKSEVIEKTPQQPIKFLDRIEEKYPLFYSVFKPQLEENILEDTTPTDTTQAQDCITEVTPVDCWDEEQELELACAINRKISYWEIPPEESFDFVTFGRQNEEMVIGFNYNVANDALQFAHQLRLMQQSIIPSDASETGFSFNIKLQSPIDYVKGKAINSFKPPAITSFSSNRNGNNNNANANSNINTNSNPNRRNTNPKNKSQGGFKGKNTNNQRGNQRSK